MMPIFKLFFFIGLMLSWQKAAALVCGQLAAVKGPAVEILRMQQAREGERIRHGMRIEEGRVLALECDDIVLTGRDSSAKIILAHGKLSLGPDSRIEMAAHDKAVAPSQTQKVSLINLTYGKMRALIQNTKTQKPVGDKSQSGRVSPQTFRVRTFSAVAGVRGTDFFTSYEPNSGLTEQATLEGLVEVQQTGTSQAVLVGAGKQVSVETTAAAVAAAKARLASDVKTGQELEPPKQTPESDAAVKPIQVLPIRELLRNEIRVASAIVKDDREFAHPKAVEAIGRPETWTLEREAMPKKFDKLKNEF